MKIRLLIFIVSILLCWNVRGQTTASDWISAGRSSLVARNLNEANNAFAQAVALEPTNETANAFYAVTRLLILPGLPAGSNFLTRIGLPIVGRSIYNWTSTPPKDLKGIFLAPNGVNMNEFVAQMRTNALPAIIGAVGNLSAIHHTNFILNLASSETAMVGVTVDYGDLKLIQSVLYGAEYAIYVLNTHNLDAQLTDFYALYTNGLLSASRVLADYPQLFTFSDTNDLKNASIAFTNGINAYMAASTFIRSRPTNEVRLFTFSSHSAQNEGGFRLVLQDLKNSLLLGPQILALNPDLMVDMTPQFDGSLDLRSLLPRLDGNAIELGSVPDLSFGGAIYGLTTEETESFLGRNFTMLPVGSPPGLAGNKVNLSFTTLTGNNYALETSTNLRNWRVVTALVAAGPVTALADSNFLAEEPRFYRLRDDTGIIALSGEVRAENTGLLLAGARIYSVWDGTETFTDANGQFYLKTTLSTAVQIAQLEVSAQGYNTNQDFYYGSGLISGLEIYLGLPPPNDNFAARTVLSGSNVSTNGDNFGGTKESTEPYDFNGSIGSRSVWFTWTAPSSGSFLISDSTTTVRNPILTIYTGDQLSNLTQIENVHGVNYHATLMLSADAGETYQIELDGYHESGGPYILSISQ